MVKENLHKLGFSPPHTKVNSVHSKKSLAQEPKETSVQASGILSTGPSWLCQDFSHGSWEILLLSVPDGEWLITQAPKWASSHPQGQSHGLRDIQALSLSSP